MLRPQRRAPAEGQTERLTIRAENEQIFPVPERRKPRDAGRDREFIAQPLGIHGARQSAAVGGEPLFDLFYHTYPLFVRHTSPLCG